MTKQMKKIAYEAPVTQRFLVEMEGAICGASAEVRNPNTNNGRIDDQEINTGFDANNFQSSWVEGE